MVLKYLWWTKNENKLAQNFQKSCWKNLILKKKWLGSFSTTQQQDTKFCNGKVQYPKPKKCTEVKTMLMWFLYIKGIVHYIFISSKQTSICLQILEHLLSPPPKKSGFWIMTIYHTAPSVNLFLAKIQIPVLKHPTLLTWLDPMWPVSKLKISMKQSSFESPWRHSWIYGDSAEMISSNISAHGRDVMHV